MKIPRLSPTTTALTAALLVVIPVIALRYWSRDTRVLVDVAPNTYARARAEQVREIQQSYPDSIRKTPAIISHVHTEEIQTVALGLFLTALLDQIEGKSSGSFSVLCESARQRDLLPPGIRMGPDGNLKSDFATYHTRYRADPIAVEVFFFSSRPSDGPSMATRIPDLAEKGTLLTELRVAAKDGPVQIAQYIHTFRQTPKLPPFMASPAELQSFGWVPIASIPPKNGENYEKAISEANRLFGQ